MSLDSPTGIPPIRNIPRRSDSSDITVGDLSDSLSETTGGLTGESVHVFRRSRSPLEVPTAASSRRYETISTPSRRDAIRRALGLAINEAERMETFADRQEFVDLSLAGFQLLEKLQELWTLRFERESDFADLLNMLQGALVQEEFERFSRTQCVSIRTILVDHLGSGPVDSDDIERSIRLLREAGFDPWKGISGPDLDDGEQ
jgi:hypothetical protein